MKYEFFDGGTDNSRCFVNCAGMSDAEIWQLTIKFFEKLDSPSDSCQWPRYRKDILRGHNQPFLCGGCLDIGMVNYRGPRELLIYTHHARCDQSVLDRFKTAVEQILS